MTISDEDLRKLHASTNPPEPDEEEPAENPLTPDLPGGGEDEDEDEEEEAEDNPEEGTPLSFDNPLDEAIYAIAEGGIDEELGDPETKFGWRGLLLGITEEELEETVEELELEVSGAEAKKAAGKSALVTEEEDGTVSVEYFDDETQAMAAWEDVEKEYEEEVG